MRVLLIKTSSLGDVIHTLPALTDAKRAIPDIQFDWVVEENFAEIPCWHPAVNEVIPVAIRRWRKNLWQTWKSGEWKAFKQRIRAYKYDLVIDAQGLLKSAWLTRYVKAPVAGLDKQSAREPMASRFYHNAYSVAWGQHAVERVRQLFAQALNYPLPATLGDYGLDRQRVIGDLQDNDPYLVFLHGTTWDTKHWPEYYWRQLAEILNKQNIDIKLPWGNEKEKLRAEQIAKDLVNVEVLPKLNLKGIASVLAAAKACVAVDTGLGHLAAALDTPTISLFGPTNPELTGSYGKDQIHLIGKYPACIPCLKKECTYQPTEQDKQQFDLNRELPICFTQVNPQQVINHLSPLLNKKPIV
ncbi:lipopolysaccharide heptosyltransferase RfaC [Entomomonas sp. E2T0]|uniref:lipopolysaccharide heptosyltransferase RfaC n=1 Tax=Entomomonas sp. E2T0 TaxID=2930213 RepID=UPI00222850BD|nr:lipopolysaccharide heptosyltransferase RfaC [Entomomonas sp. E2T0]UYZ84652.1 lipopolysaccharide heptosyltransferase RfaC [Entomomonas sp. E2T0]